MLSMKLGLQEKENNELKKLVLMKRCINKSNLSMVIINYVFRSSAVSGVQHSAAVKVTSCLCSAACSYTFQVIKRTYPTFRHKDMIKDHIPFMINVTSYCIMLPLYELSNQLQRRDIRAQHAPVSSYPIASYRSLNQ